MGYSHYWRRLDAETRDEITFQRGAFEALAIDAGRLFAGAQHLGLALGDAFGEGAPEITPGRIAFNGAAPQDYETCDFPLWLPSRDFELGGRSFEFCKTAHRPYDVVVVAFLLLAESHYGASLRLSSDGDEQELAPGLDLARALFPGRGFSLEAFGSLSVEGVVQ